MKCNRVKYPGILILIGFIAGCNNTQLNLPESLPSNTPLSSQRLPESVHELLAPLQAGDFGKFYQQLEGKDQQVFRGIRAQLEALTPAQRAGLNYGALLNAGLITDANRALFKPDIKKIDQYSNVPNGLRCFMNASLYSMANSAFFDELLEIDRLKSKEWGNRVANNLVIANRVLRTLREVVYEIRLGLRTTPERIAKARRAHIESLENLHALDVITCFYHELFEKYNLENIEAIVIDQKTGNATYSNIEWNQIPFEFDIVKQALDQYKIVPESKGPGHLGALSCSLTSNEELVYITALFIILDPWGATARYLSASFKENNVKKDDEPSLDDPYTGRLVFDSSDKLAKIYFFFNDWYFEKPVSLSLRDVVSQETLGRLIYKKRAKVRSNLQLVAKTKGSTNHMIAELFSFARQEWETHDFFGPARFSKKESDGGSGYKDHTYFYEVPSAK